MNDYVKTLQAVPRHQDAALWKTPFKANCATFNTFVNVQSTNNYCRAKL